MSENDITGDVLDAAIKIHRRFGPGMLESIYEQLLEAELARRGHKVERQKSVVVINFGMATIKEGFIRVVNGFKDNNSQRLCLSASLRETDSSQESVI